MMRCAAIVGWLLGLLCARSLAPAMAADQEPNSPRPKLVVLLVIDQMRGDYLQRWEKHFCPDGFQRLMREGAWFQNCRYPYAATMTGPGHASLVTGTIPRRHGIIMNDWYDRGAGKMVNCVENDRFERVPRGEPSAEPASETKKKKDYGVGPERLLAPTLGDALKKQLGENARVVALSQKDRSAVLLGGRKPDLCVWLDDETSRSVTSSYYAAFPPFAATYNRESDLSRWFDKPWERFRPEADYVRAAGPDNVTGEGTGSEQGRTFPHPMHGGSDKPGKKYHKAVYQSPFGNELLLDLSLRAIDSEKLGQGKTVDLLCLSFSSTDVVGHIWGPDSQEVFDCTLRMDDILRRLLAYLDERVGRGKYVVALSADHGICPLPELSVKNGAPAARISSKTLDREIEAALREKFDPTGKGGAWVEKGYYPWVYLNEARIRAAGLQTAAVENAVVKFLQQRPGIQTAFTRSELLGNEPKEPVAAAVWRSAHLERCGNVYVVTRPFWLIAEIATGTSHGTPHDYDNHVPLVIWGPGVQAAIHPEPVVPQVLPALLSAALRISPPDQAEFAAPSGVFRAAK